MCIEISSLLKLFGAEIVKKGIHGIKLQTLNDMFRTKSKKYITMCASINSILYENYKLYYENCPFIDIDIDGQIEVDNWYTIQETMIVPNNDKILATIKDSQCLIPNDKIDLFLKMQQHINSFNKHVSNRNLDYSKHQFPKDFQLYISSIVTSKFKHNVNKISKWINREIYTYDSCIEKKILYGSVLFNDYKKCDDVDVVIMCNKELPLITNKLQAIQDKFNKKFKLRLHYLIFSQSENDDFNDFINKLYYYKEI